MRMSEVFMYDKEIGLLASRACFGSGPAASGGKQAGYSFLCLTNEIYVTLSTNNHP